MDSLPALTDSERATIAEFEREEPGLDPRPLLEIVRRLAALRPFAAPVGVEAFEGLRREHGATCGINSCLCDAAEWNARVDAARSAHVAALGEVERLSAAILATPDPSCPRCGSVTCDVRSAESDPAVSYLIATEEGYNARVRLSDARNDCLRRSAVDWPSVLAGLRQSAGGK